jgi:hypothetical protein
LSIIGTVADAILMVTPVVFIDRCFLHSVACWMLFPLRCTRPWYSVSGLEQKAHQRQRSRAARASGSKIGKRNQPC